MDTKTLILDAQRRLEEIYTCVNQIWNKDFFDRRFQFCEKKFNYFPFSLPELDFSLKGQTAGQAFPAKNLIRINLQLYRENYEDYLAETLPHEVAHLIVVYLHIPPRSLQNWAMELSSHGREWQEVAKQLGCKGNRCHTYATTSARVTRKFTFKCACAQREVGANVAAKINAGSIRICKKCNHVLVRPEQKSYPFDKQRELRRIEDKLPAQISITYLGTIGEELAREGFNVGTEIFLNTKK